MGIRDWHPIYSSGSYPDRLVYARISFFAQFTWWAYAQRLYFQRERKHTYYITYQTNNNWLFRSARKVPIWTEKVLVAPLQVVWRPPTFSPSLCWKYVLYYHWFSLQKRSKVIVFVFVFLLWNWNKWALQDQKISLEFPSVHWEDTIIYPSNFLYFPRQLLQRVYFTV